jgi:hypothetical protein
MQMFAFEPSDYADLFAKQDYVHIRAGLTPEYYAVLCRQIEAYQDANRLAKFAIGNKQQSLYEFPNEGHCHRQFVETVSDVCGMDAERFVISERHIKAYEPDADPMPLVHKDRFATEVSVGFSVHVSEKARLVLYPHDERDVNAFNSAAELRASLDPDRVPEKTLRNARRVEIADAARDVIIFKGNSIWHTRENPANTVMLYFKVNAFNADPIGEDPCTADVGKRSRELASKCDDEMLGLVPLMGRKVDYVHRRYNHHWQEVLGVVLSGEKHFTVDDFEFRLLQSLDGRRTIGDVLALANGHSDHAECLNKVRRLVRRGIVDLLPAASAPARVRDAELAMA